MGGWFVISDEVAMSIIEDYIRTKHGFQRHDYKVQVKRDDTDKLFRVEVGPEQGFKL